MRALWIGVLAATVGSVATGAVLIGAFDGPRNATAATNDVAPIAGHVFRSVSVEQDGAPAPLFTAAPPFWLSIERRSFGVYAGCNRAGGPLRVSASRLYVSEIEQTLMGCPGERDQRDEFLVSFLARDPEWRMHEDRLVLVQGPTTVTMERADFPPPLPRPNPARPRDLIDARIGSGHFQTWPPGIGDSWGGPVFKVDVAVRGRRTVLTMQARCRRLEAPVTIHRTTLAVGAPRTKTGTCRRSGYDPMLDSVRPFFGGTVTWHLDRGRLTLQRDRSTLTLRAR